ncbi:dihydrofolate reductase family protein [Billgrantia kenyensis]|uniref:Dihydrofolate reductase n=1 Tax=Billgrantia kenyensis TaxID=321266 RepID=A0A7V9W4B9_9GAMM|nr:dihydrofolate reductase family protein [Halomonas kenyensis]MBA2780817.1 dihydrofolate reductase family protein [Halomonas kenyensis]MCG6661735.1 dihydrofolate reductase [Halomonas kenyensis]
MSQLRVSCFSISLDGYAAGPEQSLENPMGVNGLESQDWQFATATFQRKVLGQSGGETGIDDDIVARGFDNVGAWIIGRNMFGPVRGPWPDESWRGWWGDTPPFHMPVFVLTHHARDPIEMAGGTTFHFVTEGIHAALERAREAAKGKEVRLGGGVATVQQYLQAQLVDELHLAVTPVLLGAGEHLFAGLDMRALGYRCVERVTTEKVTHMVLRRSAARAN